MRKNIDAVDAQLVQLLAQRLNISREIAEYKKQNDIPPKDKKREQVIIEDRTAKFKELGIDDERFVRTIWIDPAQIKRDPAMKTAKPQTISIIGGRGKMGSIFAGRFH